MTKTKKEENDLCLRVKETTFHRRRRCQKMIWSILKLGYSPCHLVEILQDTNCEPCQFNVNDLPSRQRITKAESVVTKLDETAVWSGILENLTDVLDTAIIPDVEKCKKFVQQNLLVDIDMCKDIQKKPHQSKMSAKLRVVSTKKVSITCIIVWLCYEGKEEYLSKKHC